MMCRSDLAGTHSDDVQGCWQGRCAHGDVVFYPVTEVEMEENRICLQVKAVVSDSLPRSVRSGRDVAHKGHSWEE